MSVQTTIYDELNDDSMRRIKEFIRIDDAVTYDIRKVINKVYKLSKIIDEQQQLRKVPFINESLVNEILHHDPHKGHLSKLSELILECVKIKPFESYDEEGHVVAIHYMYEPFYDDDSDDSDDEE